MFRLFRLLTELKLSYILVINLFITAAFAFVSNDQPLNFMPDEKEYVLLADKALQGDFNFDIGRFIRSPLYPLFLAAIKLLFGNLWMQAVIVIHVILQAVACAGLFYLTRELFNRQTAVISALLFSIYIPCFYYIKAISSETLYQANYLWLLYFFLLSVKREQLKYVLITGVLFSAAYLNRSQIGLFAPFMVLGYLLSRQFSFGKRFIKITVFTALAVIPSLPWAFTNLKLHDLFITSSNGGTWVFLIGNSNTGYSQTMETHDINSRKYRELQTLETAIPKEMGQPDILTKSSKEKQQAFSAYGKKWVSENFGKFIKLKAALSWYYFLPGLMKMHHPFKKWLMSFLVSLPFYALGYIGIIIAFKNNWRDHLWFGGYFITIFILMVVFVFSSRFRTYGVEALYLMYAAVPLSLLLYKLFPQLADRSLFRN